MTIHHSTNIHGMGAFEGLQESVLLRQKIARNAKLALADLPDADFAEIAADAMRRRPAVVAGRIIDAVTK